MATGDQRRVLVSTRSMRWIGGVRTMTNFVQRTLRSRNFTPVVAHYEPYSVNPSLSVPSFRLLQRRLNFERGLTDDNCEAYAIGAWFPELEFTHYFATEPWMRLMDDVQAYVTVSGNALSALPYHQTGHPFLAWIATGWQADRVDRIKHYPLLRKILDRTIIAPVARGLERSILRNGMIVALSDYTRRTLDEIAGKPVVRDVLPQPVDTNFFHPRPEARVRGRIGFSGRLSDPRKNVELLIEALAVMVRRGHEITALLVGGQPSQDLTSRLASLGIESRVEFYPFLEPETLRDQLRALDLFVVPSRQEGLCIAALEAMACGTPVVSTRCGGPEEFVIDGETGRLVDFDPEEMADAVVSIASDPAQRERLGTNARQLVLERYSNARAEEIFWTAFEHCFPGGCG